jgi:preprotein translocase subunit SecA
MFHFILQRPAFKGRIVQVATGGGKKIIIAMLALAVSLMGYFIDVITSTRHLENRDWNDFAPLFAVFRVSSSTIAHNNFEQQAFNGIILYGKNADFECRFLLNGIFISKVAATIPFGGSTEIARSADLAIIDESETYSLIRLRSQRSFGPTRRCTSNEFIAQLNDAVCRRILSVPGIRQRLEEFDAERTASLTDEMIATEIFSAQ